MITPRAPMLSALVLAALTVCFWPIAGRSAQEWLPITARHGARRALGRHRHRSAAPQAGVRANGDGRPEPVVSLPEAAAGLELLAAPLRGETIGVLKDRRFRTYTAVLAVKVTSFGLLDQSEQEARAKRRRSAGCSGCSVGCRPRHATKPARTCSSSSTRSTPATPR